MTKKVTDTPRGVASRPYVMKHGHHNFLCPTCAPRTSYDPDLDKRTNCQRCRPVEYRVFVSRNSPSRKFPWYSNPVPWSAVLFVSRKIPSRAVRRYVNTYRPNCPVQSRDGSIPSCTVPCLPRPFLSRSGKSRNKSTPRMSTTAHSIYRLSHVSLL